MQSLLETNVPSGRNGIERQAGREGPHGRIQIDDRIHPRLTPDFDNRDMAGIRGVSDLRRRTTFVRNNEHHRYVNHRGSPDHLSASDSIYNIYAAYNIICLTFRFTLKAKRHALGQMRREFLQCQEELSEKKSQKTRDSEFPIWSTSISSIQSQKGSGVAAYFRLVQEKITTTDSAQSTMTSWT